MISLIFAKNSCMIFSIPKRFSALKSFVIFYLIASFFVRLSLYFISLNSMDFSILSLLKIFGIGLLFDFATALFFMLFYALYLFIIPRKIIGSIFDRIVTHFILFITLLIAFFSFLAEFPFWDEFNTRFNFIAVDYLIYTYEVFENINQSYPLPLLILGLLLLVIAVIFVFHKRQIFQKTFNDKIGFIKRTSWFIIFLIPLVFFVLFLDNKDAEWSQNTYESELSKNGTFSFIAAYRSNELDFNTFYQKLDDKESFSIIKKELLQSNQQYISNDFWNIKRKVINDSTEIKPNVVLICIESFSAEFMQRFGNKNNITPNIDNIAKQSIFFTNLYATGTRTVRGMEAITLCVPPTPGNSIVRRPNNDSLFSVNTIFKAKNYNSYFVYGGDGYFDNMNTFFGGQGFNIIDRNRGNPLSDNIKTQRINIEDNEVKFENAWGISDEDIYTKLLKQQDENFNTNKTSFYFVMTTSNHKPYTFPEGKIDLPQGNRDAAVKYTDFALGEYLKKAQQKPWFANTIFVIVADHCASSAGKWELNVDKHHIPAMIYNSGKNPLEINKLVSQIDVMPTLFGLLHWNYETALFGKDIFLMNPEEERALIGNYRTLGLLKANHFTEINDRKKVIYYNWNAQTKELSVAKENQMLKNLTISYYQTPSYLFSQGKMKE